MRQNSVELIMPLLNFLGSLIYQYGDYLFMVFTCLAILLIAWTLSGGLRRKLPHGNPSLLFSCGPTR
jgi:hypothetical protein